MFGLFGSTASSPKQRIVTAAEALPGRTKPIATGSRHVVLGTDIQAPLQEGQEAAIFGCGCFWGAEKGFWRLPGVVTTAVGYAAGHTLNPTYEEVCSGRTGHTEVVRVVWNTTQVGFSDLLKLFWECHDPTQGLAQGHDTGSQYRSAIVASDLAQFALAEASRSHYQGQLEAAGFGPITTEITVGQPFYFAETPHQQYLARPGSRPYCSARPSGVRLTPFPGSAFLLPSEVWNQYDWSVQHCVLRSSNEPIRL
ncbi:peptide-methionine (S)-S-oxide reductase MsrA [Synechococcus sp. Tobar12-5m-g]|nr:peptide-methionine (S)-S-oxide reductase MsrA [Synechococcus sp. Tobar12-5m-g]MCP9873191.1 peptide-methionine (S)-S-oxide reductase MsrA [Synechococcus sp. Cruz CV-v-12]